MPIRILVALALLGATASVTHTAQQRVRVTGFFSTLGYHRESGDLAGVEVFISYARVRPELRALHEGRHYAYVQIAEGSPDEPQLVPVQVDSNRVSFSLTGKYSGINPFSGSVVGDSLIGRFANGWELRLPRRASYWR